MIEINLDYISAPELFKECLPGEYFDLVFCFSGLWIQRDQNISPNRVFLPESPKALEMIRVGQFRGFYLNSDFVVSEYEIDFNPGTRPPEGDRVKRFRIAGMGDDFHV